MYHLLSWIWSFGDCDGGTNGRRLRELVHWGHASRRCFLYHRMQTAKFAAVLNPSASVMVDVGPVVYGPGYALGAATAVMCHLGCFPCLEDAKFRKGARLRAEHYFGCCPDGVQIVTRKGKLLQCLSPGRQDGHWVQDREAGSTLHQGRLDLLRAIAANPEDVDLLWVYADWLEENGSTHAATELRDTIHWSPPEAWAKTVLWTAPWLIEDAVA